MNKILGIILLICLSPVFAVSGGEKASKEHPLSRSIVQVLVNGVGNRGCTGTLISLYHVLTAKHCMMASGSKPRSFDKIKIEFASPSGGNERRGVKTSYLMQAKKREYKCVPVNIDNICVQEDLAIVEMELPSPPHAVPLKVVPSDFANSANMVWMTGTGLEDSNNQQSFGSLRYLPVHIVNKTNGVLEGYRKVSGLLSYEGLMLGDSGAPLLIRCPSGMCILGTASVATNGSFLLPETQEPATRALFVDMTQTELRNFIQALAPGAF